MNREFLQTYRKVYREQLNDRFGQSVVQPEETRAQEAAAAVAYEELALDIRSDERF